MVWSYGIPIIFPPLYERECYFLRHLPQVKCTILISIFVLTLLSFFIDNIYSSTIPKTWDDMFFLNKKFLTNCLDKKICRCQLKLQFYWLIQIQLKCTVYSVFRGFHLSQLVLIRHGDARSLNLKSNVASELWKMYNANWMDIWKIMFLPSGLS